MTSKPIHPPIHHPTQLHLIYGSWYSLTIVNFPMSLFIRPNFPLQDKKIILPNSAEATFRKSCGLVEKTWIWGTNWCLLLVWWPTFSPQPSLPSSCQGSWMKSLICLISFTSYSLFIPLQHAYQAYETILTKHLNDTGTCLLWIGSVPSPLRLVINLILTITPWEKVLLSVPF